MDFVKSQSMKISVLPEQEKELSSRERIVSACKQPDVLAFDIFCNESLIGFVMVRQYENNEFFLWNYAIDYRYQNQNLGTTALVEFISYMQKEYNMKVMTTTYIWGNEHAKHIYEKIGFVETDIIDEPDCHEVNMIFNCI